MLATVLWLLATIAFGWWVRHVANYNVLYGVAILRNNHAVVLKTSTKP